MMKPRAGKVLAMIFSIFDIVFHVLANLKILSLNRVELKNEKNFNVNIGKAQNYQSERTKYGQTVEIRH